MARELWRCESLEFLDHTPHPAWMALYTRRKVTRTIVSSPAHAGGNYTDTTGERAMGYYDQDFLNYYYYMASQFAVSDRWFSPVSSKSVPNRIATFTGGTTQGLIADPGSNDHLPQLNIPTIFQELDTAKVTWKVYYTVTDDLCLASRSLLDDQPIRQLSGHDVFRA